MSLIYNNFKKLIPDYIIDAAKILAANGYDAYLVGGSIRDILIGITPNDFDIATNAYPDEVTRIFPKSIPTGAKFGTITVITSDEKGEKFDVQITTYRSEADYVGGRWPSKVEFARTIEEDLSRRDFTINAIALNLINSLQLAVGSTANSELQTLNSLIDPYNGIQDLEDKIIRAVRDPIERFSEDGLRAVRACRLASQLQFTIQEKTFEAIKQTLHVTKMVSVERFRDELVKMLMKSSKPSIGLRLMRESGILELFIPELLEGVDVVQPQFHEDNVFEHSIKTVDEAEDSVKLAALFHDIGKPRTKSEDEKGIHFYGHDVTGAEMTSEIMKRLKFSNAEIDHTVSLVRWHMFYYPSADWRQENKKIKLIVLRHGRTDGNDSKTVLGHIDEPLNDKGKKEAEKSAVELRPFGIDLILASPLKRAYETAEIVNKEVKAKIEIRDELIERNFGELQGLSWEEFETKYPELARHPDNTEIRQAYLPNGESIQQVEQRVGSLLDQIKKEHEDKTILIVTHAGVIRVIKRLLENYLDQHQKLDYEGKIDPDNGEYFVITINMNTGTKSDYAKHGWTDGAIRRLIQNVGGEESIDDLLKLRIADQMSNKKYKFNQEELDSLSERIADVRAKEMALKVTDLDITGEDLIENFGLEPGKKVGEILNYLLDKVIDEPAYNKKLDLLRLAKSYLEKGR